MTCIRLWCVPKTPHTPSLALRDGVEEVVMLSVKLFAKARDLVGSAVVQIPWSDGQSVANLKQQLGERYPGLLPLVPRLLVAVNNDYAGEATTLSSNDEVACFPPVSGG